MKKILAGSGILALTAAGAVATFGASTAPAASTPACGMTVTGSMSGPSGSRWEHVTVRNCHDYTVRRRVVVSNWVDDVCEQYGAGPWKYLEVWTAPTGSHAVGLKEC